MSGVTRKLDRSAKMKIILSIIAISFMQGLQFCVAPVLKQIQDHYSSVDVSFVQMLITAPSFVALIFALLSGVLVTKISKKKLLIFSGLLSGITGFLPFLADSFWLLFACRVIYGVGLGLATTLNTAVVAEWFEGDERVQVMGIQAASVGSGMAIIQMLGGVLGAGHFTGAYWINVIGFLSFFVIAVTLPDSGTAAASKGEKIVLNRRVFEIAGFGFLELLFLITFSTNISMHLSGSIAGDAKVSGLLTGLFSAAQIVVGLILGIISKRTGKFTLPTAMGSLVIGLLFLILFPSNTVMLIIGALFCGFSQGIFIPTAMVEETNAVAPIAAAMASGVLTCGTNFGQTVSPFVLNTVSKAVFGQVTTTNVYVIAAVGMVVSTALCILWCIGSGRKTVK